MYEEQFILMLWISAALALWVIKLKFGNRKLRRQLAAKTAVEPVALETAAPAPALPPRDPEVDRLRERVAVLERITVEKEHSLAREIDGLRAR
jgi:hypothetical protein